MELILTGYIDSYSSESYRSFRNGILENRKQPLEMVICSGGGSVIDGLELSALIKTHEATTKAICVGFVASIATPIALSADKVVMDENGSMLIHNTMGGNYGTSEDLRMTASQLDGFSKQIMSYYVGRIAKNGKLINNSVADTEAMLAECMKEERILSAAECYEMGLVDKIINAQIPAQVSDNTEVLIEQINKTYPTASAKFNFTNCFQNMKNETLKEQVQQAEEVKPVQDKKGLFKTFTDAFAALLGFKNEAQPIESPAESVEDLQTEQQIEEEMTEEQMIEHLKAQGFDVSEKQPEVVQDVQPEAETPVAKVENSAADTMKAELEAMKQQLADMKSAAEKASFDASTKAAGLHETASDSKKVKVSALRNKVANAIGNNLSHELKLLK